MTFLERFWSKVNQIDGDACWEWTAARFPTTGYGAFWVDGNNRGAHRIAWSLENGPIPSGLYVCHHCDNRACCRPSHMFLGTLQDNNRDRTVKGRTRCGVGVRHSSVTHPEAVPKGDGHWNARLTTDTVREMRALWQSGESQSRLARLFMVDPSTVSLVVHNRRWGHVA